MSGENPLPTAVLIHRLRRVAVWLDKQIDPDDADHDHETQAAIRARANVCWQAAGRLEDLSDGTKLVAESAVTD